MISMILFYLDISLYEIYTIYFDEVHYNDIPYLNLFSLQIQDLTGIR